MTEPKKTRKAPKKAVALPRQPELNIGTIGHVDHGKTTLVEALTGTWAARHSEELKRGITIRLGYADMPIYKCQTCDSAKAYSTKSTCPSCHSKGTFVRAISFVDAPGHEALMATMLSGAAIMDGAILVIAADEQCPQPQTREHLAAAEIVGIKDIIIVQNKIDIVDNTRARKSYEEIRGFIEGTVAEDAPIIPISAQRSVNTDVLVQAIEEFIPTPERDDTRPPFMYIVRSFDVNRPGTSIDELKGGVIGGTILEGKLEVGQEMEIRPGISVEREGKRRHQALTSEITSLQAGGGSISEAHCGGLIGVGTMLDPSLSKADALTGNVAGRESELPPVVQDLTLRPQILERAVGTKELAKVEEIRTGEPLLLHVGAAITMGKVASTKKKSTTVQLARPVCARVGSRVALSRKMSGRWRLIGYGMTE